MSDPLIGAMPGASGMQGGSARDVQARGAAGGRTLACLFATRARAEEARDALLSAGTPDGAVQITSQEGGTAEEGGGVWESIKRLFTGNEADSYYEGVNRGQTLVTVRAQSADDADRLLAILERYDPVDLDAQEMGWRSQGWTGRQATGAGSSQTAYGQGERGADEAGGKPAALSTAIGGTNPSGRAGGVGAGEQVIPVVDEHIAIGKRQAGMGSVRVRAYTVETPVEEDVQLREEKVHVERRPVDREVGGDSDAFQDRTIEVSETREEPMVQKSARVTEEVVVRKDESERTERVSDKVRKTQVDVQDERVGEAGGERLAGAPRTQGGSKPTPRR
jgi:uncharacterized protein (TIGR02271 family)